jgi:hypothetical protein
LTNIEASLAQAKFRLLSHLLGILEAPMPPLFEPLGRVTLGSRGRSDGRGGKREVHARAANRP